MRILVVENDARMRTFLEGALTSQSMIVDLILDWTVVVREALAMEYDVILIGAVLPKMGGGELCSELRKKGVKSPIIVISDRSVDLDAARILDSGADDFLEKPFNYTELLARIRALTRRKAVFFNPQLEIADIVIDCNKRMVTRGKNSIRLSPKEFRLLEFLARNHGQTLSRVEILENVWGSATVTFSNIVDVHVSNLRSKIDRGFAKPLIHTLRGGGYVFEDGRD